MRDVVTALAFLNRKGLFHGDIKGNLFARNHLRLAIILYNLQISFFIGSHLCRYQISLEMRAIPGRSAQVTIVFKNVKSNFEVVEEVDTFYSNHPEMKLV